MKNRQKLFELAIVIGVVASVVVWYRGDSTFKEPAPERASVVYATATPAADAFNDALPEPMEIHSLWKSQFAAAQDALGQGDNKKAETYLLDALRSAPQAGDEALHETLDDLGLVCFRLGDYRRSAEFQSRAIEAAKKLKRPDREATVGLYESRYAQALAGLDQRDEALLALQRARVAYEMAYPAGSPAHADALNSLAAQHRSLGDNDGAARLLSE